MTEYIYNSDLFYRFDLLRIIEKQTNSILILTNNFFATKKIKAIKIAKIITKNCKYLTFSK